MNIRKNFEAYLSVNAMKLFLFLILLFVSNSSFACKCASGNIDSWIENSIEIVHVKVMSTHIEPDDILNNIRINYEVIERFTGQEKDTGFVFDGLHNCSIWMRAGSEYLLFISESRSITHCTGSKLITPWHEKSKKLLDEVRTKSKKTTL